MTLIEVINAKNAIKKYFDKIPPGATMYRIVKFVWFAEEQEKHFNTVNAQLLARYGERDAAGSYVLSENGKGYKIKQEHAQDFLIASLELQNAEVKCETALTLDEITPLEITANDLYHIFPIIKDE